MSDIPTPPLYAIPTQPRGSLVIIGGSEAKDGHRPILEDLARRADSGKLVVATLASTEPEEQWEKYRKAFSELGVGRLEHLQVDRREELLEQPRYEVLDNASVLFFTGGDQVRITSKFGGTPLCTRMRELYEAGATIAGTSSGASVMSEVMMAGGDEQSSKIASTFRLAPGLALVPGMIIDQHFGERGRIGRLITAVGQNPRLLGIGIDEDTAIVLESHREFAVMGTGAVFVVDGLAMRFSNAAEDLEGAPSVYGLTVHMLSKGDRFELNTRKPAK